MAPPPPQRQLAAPPLPGLAPSLAWTCSAATGFVVMSSEITLGRLVAPYLGTSSSTWALLIGSVLLSLSAGSLLGGRMSRSPRRRSWLTVALLLAALLLGLLPLLLPGLLGGSLHRLQRGEVLALAGGALAALGLMATPLVLLGTVSPLLLHLAGQRAEARGDLGAGLGGLAGSLAAAGTLGSLLGTFAAGLWLIPWLGSRATLQLGALVLAAQGASLAILGAAPARSRRGPATALALLAVALPLGLSALAPAWTQASRGPGRVIHAEETRYNYLSVHELKSQRQLRLNDGYAVQSFANRDGSLPLDGIWSFYAMAPSFGQRPAPRRVLILGLGGGSAAQLYQALYPTAQITGVELDAAVVEAGRTYLGLGPERLDVVIDDARRALARWTASPAGPRFDLVLLDAFQFPYIPFQLATQECFRLIATVLEPGGAVMVNVGRQGDERAVVDAVARTLASVFPTVLAADASNRSNTLLVATAHAADQAQGPLALALPRSLEARYGLRARFAGHWRRFHPALVDPAAPLLTDDHAPVEWLTDRIVLRTLWKELGLDG